MKRILLVEDEKEISLMVKNYLTKEGYIVDTAFNGEEGLFQFRQKDYSLVILDIMMPKMDGIELIKRIREKSNVPAIILSAKDGEIDKALGLGFGADDYVAKQKLSLFTISSIFFKSSVIVYLNILLKIDKKAIY